MILGQLLAGDRSHLWFLLVLFIIFVLAGALELYFPGRTGLKLAAAFALYMANQALGWNTHSVQGMLLWFYVGYWFEGRRTPWAHSWRSPLGGAILFCLLFVLKYLFHWEMGEQLLFGPALALAGSYMVYAFSACLAGTGLTEQKLYQLLLRNSFSIYLYADPLNYVLLAAAFGLFGSALFAGPWLCLGLYFLRSFAPLLVSILLGELLRRAGCKTLC